MSGEKRLFRRRTYFIKKSFQFKFILKFCLVVLGGVFVSTGIFFLLSSGSLTSSFQDSRLVIKETSYATLPIVLYTNLITLGMITIATIFITLLVSHKLAGPLFRFEKDLNEIGKGNLVKQIKLRKQDQLKDVAESLNAMINDLHAKVLDIRTELDQIIKLASQQKVSDELFEKLNHLRQGIDTKFQL